MASRTFSPISADYAIEQITDVARLRDLARLYRSAMIYQHAQGEHLLGIGDCAPCLKAADEGDPFYACDHYKRWQKAYEDALAANLSAEAVTR